MEAHLCDNIHVCTMTHKLTCFSFLPFCPPPFSHVQLSFEQAAERVKSLKTKPSNEVLLQLYGLYKQATAGDNTASQPWAVQLEARAKWDAWTSFKGQSK